jgi:hypothetical protein
LSKQSKDKKEGVRIIDFLKRLEEHCSLKKQITWEGTLQDYLAMLKEKPYLAQLAHARIYSMISDAGVEERGGVKHYAFFNSELFGLDKTLEKLVEEYLHPAARRLDVRKRILLLMGPVSGGKSTLVTLLKRGLEKYSREERGALYGIKGCPMHEEPLHLIPGELRDDFRKEYGIFIEGELCPSCRMMLEEDYQGQIERVPVERIFLSEANRVGIGTFTPSDPKSQDIAELTGSMDFSTIAEYGSESDPRAYRFDGELNIANRGLMEFQEMLKCDEKFLWNLLSLSQEGNFKAGRFALIYADEMIVAHTNENEYKAFISNKKNEALQSRIIVLKVPYNLRVSDEIKIYEKLLRQSDLSNIHIAPHAYGMPTRFSHWTFGKAYHRMKAQYDYNLERIYELVINTDPCYAFLLDGNSLIQNKLIMAHVIAHCDFFKNNSYFKNTTRSMVESMAVAANRFREYEFLYGRDTVESFLDAAMSISEHVEPRRLIKKSCSKADTVQQGIALDNLQNCTPAVDITGYTFFPYVLKLSRLGRHFRFFVLFQVGQAQVFKDYF